MYLPVVTWLYLPVVTWLYVFCVSSLMCYGLVCSLYYMSVAFPGHTRLLYNLRIELFSGTQRGMFTYEYIYLQNFHLIHIMAKYYT